MFELWVKFPNEYPARAPEIRFLTPIRHPNVNVYGKICHPLLDRQWTADMTARSALDAVYGLLLTPDFDAYVRALKKLFPPPRFMYDSEGY